MKKCNTEKLTFLKSKWQSGTLKKWTMDYTFVRKLFFFGNLYARDNRILCHQQVGPNGQISFIIIINEEVTTALCLR